MNAFTKHFGTFSCLVILSALMLIPGVCFAHDEHVHEQITQSAFNLSANLANFITANSVSENLPASPPQCSGNQSPSWWLQMGSYYEDEQTYGWRDEIPKIGPFQRCCDHFYTVRPQRIPGLVDGLTDFSEPVGLAYLLFSSRTTNSFAWGTQSGIYGVGNVGYNLYKWSDARTNEMAALTNAAPNDRNTSMAMMFYSLGHVLHLNQDTTSPDHVRDNAHPWGRYFESYGKAHYNDPKKNQKWFALPQNHTVGWANWQAQGFTNLLNFWDRNLYKGAGADLDNDMQPGKKLGLAEFCNGNFLGERSLYMECYKPDNKRYFPYPRKSSTDYPGEPQSHTVIPNGKNLPSIITNYVVTKKGDGVAGFRHSILSYMGAKYPNVPTSHNTTINDDDVLQDYHDILIPKAVEYSAGILDYFFRATIYVTGSFDADSSQYKFKVTNTSSQDFGSGSLFLVAEDTNNVRTVVKTTPVSALPIGMSTDITCTGPAAQGTKFMAVYQGTVGADGSGNAFDPVDTNICIAAAWPFEQTITYSYWVGVSDPYPDPQETITSYLDSSDFYFTPTSGNYELRIVFANFDDKGTIGSISSSGPITSCTYAGYITNTVVPPGDVIVTNNHLRVQVTATDDPICKFMIGWQNITLTWRAWPGQ